GLVAAVEQKLALAGAVGPGLPKGPVGGRGRPLGGGAGRELGAARGRRAGARVRQLAAALVRQLAAALVRQLVVALVRQVRVVEKEAQTRSVVISHRRAAAVALSLAGVGALLKPRAAEVAVA